MELYMEKDGGTVGWGARGGDILVSTSWKYIGRGHGSNYQ